MAICPTCGASVAAGDRFCGACGHGLASAPAVSSRLPLATAQVGRAPFIDEKQAADGGRRGGLGGHFSRRGVIKVLAGGGAAFAAGIVGYVIYTQPDRPLRTIKGADYVIAVAAAPGGRYVVSGSDDGTVKVWELATGDEVRSLLGHTEKVKSVAVTPDGRYVVSAGFDDVVKVWDLATGREVHTLSGHSLQVLGVAVTPDGRHVISASTDQTIKVWDLGTGREVRTLSGHSDAVRSVAVTPDGRYVVSGSYDETVKVWELSSGREVRTLSGHSGYVFSVAVTPDGRYVVSGSHDRTIKVWELPTGRNTQTHSGYDGFALALTPDGRHVIFQGSRYVSVWNMVIGGDEPTNAISVKELMTGREVRAFAGHDGLFSIDSVAVTADGRYAISGGGDGIKVWDLSGL